MGTTDTKEKTDITQCDLERKISDLEDKLAQQANRFTDISRIGTVITSIFDLDQILPMVMESALTLSKAEVGQMVVFNKDGSIEDSVCWGISQNVTKLIRNKEDISLWDSIKTQGKWLKIEDLRNDSNWELKSDKAHIKSLVAAPLFSKNRIVGAIAIANKIDGDKFTSEDLYILEIIARFATVAVENSHLHDEALEMQKLEADIDMARQLQSMMMPKKKIEFDGLTINAYNTMAKQVGGDFYDIVQLSRSKYILIIADVSDKGFPASLLMTSSRSLLRAYAIETSSISEIIANVNEQLCGDSGALKGMFVTLIMVCLDFDNNEIKAVNAGHPPGWIRYPDGKIAEMKTGGPFVGQFQGLEYDEQVLPLVPGSRMFLYTDGIFECVDNDGNMLGVSGIRSFFEDHMNDPPEEFESEIKKLMVEYSVDPERIDDTTYILVDIK